MLSAWFYPTQFSLSFLGYWEPGDKCRPQLLARKLSSLYNKLFIKASLKPALVHLWELPLELPSSSTGFRRLPKPALDLERRQAVHAQSHVLAALAPASPPVHSLALPCLSPALLSFPTSHTLGKMLKHCMVKKFSVTLGHCHPPAPSWPMWQAGTCPDGPSHGRLLGPSQLGPHGYDGAEPGLRWEVVVLETAAMRRPPNCPFSVSSTADPTCLLLSPHSCPE